MIFMFIYLFIGMAAMAKHNQQKHFMMINNEKKKKSQEAYLQVTQVLLAIIFSCIVSN